MKLLIVDDSKLNRVIAKTYIRESDLTLEILEAASGEEAQTCIQSDAIDLILLDIVMPGIDGVGVLKWLKGHEAYKHIRVIMFTTLNEKTLLQNCFDIGASDFIHKPLERIEFIARIKSIMRQRQLELETFNNILEIKAQKDIISDFNMHMMHQEKMASVGQLAAGVAHEINNPLGFISSNFGMLKDYIQRFVRGYDLVMAGGDPKAVLDFYSQDAFKHMIEDIDELFEETGIGVKRVTQIVKSLRNFSHVESNDAPGTYDINEGLRDTLIIANNHLKYVTHVTTDFQEVDKVMAYGSQVNQVFLNLLINAVYAIQEKFKGEMGEILLKTYREPGGVAVEIIDNGKGMTQATLKDLFNPFYTTKPVGEGTGLGLSISYDIIVNKHQGKLEVTSTLGQGSCFKVYIPTTLEGGLHD